MLAHVGREGDAGGLEDPAERLDDRNMERVSGAPYHPLTQSKIETNVRTWVHSRRAPEAALTVSYAE